MLLKFSSTEELWDFAFFEEQKANDFFFFMQKNLIKKHRVLVFRFIEEKKQHQSAILNLRTQKIENYNLISIDDYKAWQIAPHSLNKGSYHLVMMAIEMSKHLLRFYNQLAVNCQNEEVVIQLKQIASQELEQIKHLEQIAKSISLEDAKPKLRDNLHWIKLNSLLEKYAILGIVFLFTLIAIRIFDAFVNPLFFNCLKDRWQQVIQGLPYDTVLGLGFIGLIAIPFFLIAYFKEQLAIRIGMGLSIIFLLLNLILMAYFAKTAEPLTFPSQYHQLYKTLIELKIGYLALLLVFPVVYSLLVFLLKKYYFPQKAYFIFTFIALLSLFFVLKIKPNPSHFKEKNNYYLTVNKFSYLLEQSKTNFPACFINKPSTVTDRKSETTINYDDFLEDFSFEEYYPAIDTMPILIPMDTLKLSKQ